MVGSFLCLLHERHQACPRHNRWTCPPVQSFLPVRGCWHSRSPIPGLWGFWQCESSFFRRNSLSGGKVVLSSPSAHFCSSSEHSHKNCPWSTALLGQGPGRAGQQRPQGQALRVWGFLAGGQSCSEEGKAMARAALWGEMPPTSHRHAGTFKARSHGHRSGDVQTWDWLPSESGGASRRPPCSASQETDWQRDKKGLV